MSQRCKIEMSHYDQALHDAVRQSQCCKQEARSGIESFLPAPGFSAVVRQGMIGRCSANFQFRQRHEISLRKRFLDEHGEKSWFR